jgi:hypothetical protein
MNNANDNDDKDYKEALKVVRGLPAKVIMQAICQMVNQHCLTMYDLEKHKDITRKELEHLITIDGIVEDWKDRLELTDAQAQQLKEVLKNPAINKYTNIE